MNKILKEEIDRFYLLSKYDNSKTLDENNLLVNVINERQLLRLFGRETEVLSKTATKEIESLFKTLPKEMSFFGKDAASVIKDLKTMDPNKLGLLRQTIFKNTTNQSLRQEIAKDMVKHKGFIQFFTSNDEKKVFDKMVNSGKWSGEEASFLMKTYKDSGGKFRDEIKAGLDYNRKRTKDYYRNKQKTKSTYYDDVNRWGKGERKGWASSAYNTVKDILHGVGKSFAFVVQNFWRLVWMAGILGVAYYVWNYLNKEYDIYPKCLSPDNIPSDDWKDMFNKNLKYVKTSETGNDFIDDNGGGRFYADKKFETENGKYKGTWKNDDDSDIIVTLDNGEEQIVLCQAIKDFVDPRDPKENDDKISKTIVKTPEEIEKEKIISSWSGTYTKCDDFPFGLGCKDDEIIGTVQTCLGLPRDGKFSPKVLDALEKEGYGFELTFNTYKKIQSKCGASQSKSGFASNL